LKLCPIKKIRKSFLTQDYFAKKFGGTLLKALGDYWRGNIFLAQKGEKLRYEVHQKKIIACEIRCSPLLPNSRFLLLFHPDYWRFRWCICDYWLISNEHQ